MEEKKGGVGGIEVEILAKQNAFSETCIHPNECIQYISIVLKVQAGYLQSTLVHTDRFTWKIISFMF